MMQIKVMPFNPIAANCYICYDETKACVIIDPGCDTDAEYALLFDFIRTEALIPKHIVITHPHIDHILGTDQVCKQYGLPLTMHKLGLPLFSGAFQDAGLLGIHLKALPDNHVYVEEGDILEFGNSTLRVLYTPGHADGSICLFNKESKTVFTGDVLFNDCIGRADLPTGNLELLKSMIVTKLFTLEGDVTVRSGHGGRTTIARERQQNPFF
ncbi:MBL fold hydrolase [Bacteroidia bacterium]|nr:MBL fold hydrolase [Bacteroidia bacterium]